MSNILIAEIGTSDYQVEGVREKGAGKGESFALMTVLG